MSSLGDVLHLLPALTDAHQHDPKVEFDWVVEQAFAEIPPWHPAVREVFPIQMRHWRRAPFQTLQKGDLFRFKSLLQKKAYDLVVDAQGLLKSALIASLARGTKAGFHRNSAREPLASFFYQRSFKIPKNQHAIWRLRQLMAAALNYPLTSSPPDYGLQVFKAVPVARPSVIFLHGTTWASKHYPEKLWLQLVTLAGAAGFEVKLPWGTPQEHARAQRLAAAHPLATVMPAMNLQSLADALAHAHGVIGVDSGLSHLAAALKVPSVTLYGATDPTLTGTYGQNQLHLQSDYHCSPCLKRECSFSQKLACYDSLSPQYIWQTLLNLLSVPLQND